MSLEAIIHDSLLAYGPLSALIGERLYLTQKAQRCSYPCVAYNRVTGAPLYTQDYAQKAEFGQYRFQFDIFCDTATGGETVLSVRDQLSDALRTFNAAAVPQSPAVLTQAPNFIVGERMMNEPQPQQPIWWYRVDAILWYLRQ